ncbi:prepilin-type N-terminal cleavage/methylation domain-containing protein [Planctomyces sp. SH-PL62]|uniref:prepilin-type N-terminal cleavage/methylation domain-containing protein n=1 Tax=Planctomyces sp. SH-PL62 TaxID=1636152 RepID=UPI00078B7698|nr:prepilin-type N-terminal cleavage/methylation domain-containing protein [Planctomyces sp. SH-PL62]AMV40243.1 hypothetical protein VT85_22620 [Planctomyces sp. SH-PL62]
MVRHMKHSICMPIRTSSGFTLIELSIVLVVIGLVVGGVLVGRDLIEAAKLRATASQLEQYSTAANVFKLKYGNLPGDIPANKAQAFGLRYSHAVSRNSGDGNGAFNCVQDLVYCSSGRYGFVNHEMTYFFMHLGDANLIAGNYNFYLSGYRDDGVYGGALRTTMSAGVDYPALKMNPLAGILPVTSRIFGDNWFMLSCISDTAIMGWINQNCQFGAAVPPAHDHRLLPMQAFALDSKIDDGIPSTGTVRAVRILGGAIAGVSYDITIYIDDRPNLCVTTSASTLYNTNNNSPQCSMLVKMR